MTTFDLDTMRKEFANDSRDELLMKMMALAEIIMALVNCHAEMNKSMSSVGAKFTEVGIDYGRQMTSILNRLERLGGAHPTKQ